jgi:hypothetical protein
MRCLLSLLLTVAVVVFVLWVTLPLAAGYLIMGTMSVGGFHGTDTKVDVQANPPLIILEGHADSVHLTATDVSVGDLQAGQVDLTLNDVAVISRHVGAVHGTFEQVTVRGAASPGQTTTPPDVMAQEVAVDGASNAAQATITMSGTQAASLAESELQTKTGVVATVTLKAPNIVDIKSGGHTQTARLVVPPFGSPQAGSLELVPDGGALPTVVLMSPGSGNPFTFQTVVIGTDGTGAQTVTLKGTIDIQKLIS